MCAICALARNSRGVAGRAFASRAGALAAAHAPVGAASCATTTTTTTMTCAPIAARSRGDALQRRARPPATGTRGFAAEAASAEDETVEMKGIVLRGRPLYLDMQATTPVDPRVLDAMMPHFVEQYGNPHSRTHMYGWEAEDAVEQARQDVASIIGANPK